MRTAALSFAGRSDGETEFVTATVEPADIRKARPSRPAYVEADFAVNRALEPHETPLAEMAACVVRIVGIEGPVHIDEIAARVRGLWGFARAGGRMRAAVARAAETAALRGLITGGPFHTIAGRAAAPRNRAAVASASLRKPDMLPPAEIDALILALVDDNFGAGCDELVQAAAREFGFSATSSQLRATLAARIDALTLSGALTVSGALLMRRQPAREDGER